LGAKICRGSTVKYILNQKRFIFLLETHGPSHEP
jgi:hypothetical protein